jgi:hypothetical protein
MEKTVFSFLLIATGLFCITSSLFNWDWYFNHPRARLLVRLFGRMGARVVYAILGAVLILFGASSALQ